MYHYGFSQTTSSENVVDLVAAYRSTDDVNFILVHYNGITQNTVGVSYFYKSNRYKIIKEFFS
jgi:hypothetical protein